MEVKLLKPEFLASEQLRTGSQQFLIKSNRMYVGIYDEKIGWFVPLVAKLPKRAPKLGVFKTPFETQNPHFENPGLNFQKAVFIEDENDLLPIKNNMPPGQRRFIEEHLFDITNRFEKYIRFITTLPLNSKQLSVSSVPFYPKGIQKILGQKVDRFGMEGPVTEYVADISDKDQNVLKSAPNTLEISEQHVQKEEPMMKNSADTIKELLAKKDTKALEEHLKQGMAAYLDSDTYKKFLAFSALFPQYSARNRHLIFSQNEEAQFVAGFKKWKELGNPIKKGGKSLKIMAPYKYFLKDGKGNKVLDDNDEPIERTGYRFVSVFDQSQTEHPEKIPSQLKEIKGDYSTEPKAFLNIMNALQTTTTARLTLAPIAEEKTYGYFEPKTNRIVLKEGMGQKKTVAVALHEVAHSRLHRGFSGKFGDTEYSKNEFEAESVAYIVGTTLGIDMSESSFGYMKSWQPNEKNLSALQDSFETIKKEAETMIEEIDKNLAALQQPEQSEKHSPLAEIEAARGKKIGNKSEASSEKATQNNEAVKKDSDPLAR